MKRGPGREEMERGEEEGLGREEGVWKEGEEEGRGERRWKHLMILMLVLLPQ